ncbi:uncharacterized protein [Mytilus edulis]|uniref:uncharacterized protein isoform X1 n=1 Tax=Mytilus edulis TaxID=6550 RepID=UPI0039EFB4FC
MYIVRETKDDIRYHGVTYLKVLVLHNMEEQPSTSGGIKRSIPQELQDEIDRIASKVPRNTANPADLDDNQRRWLILGICLHSVITPILRKYVVPILTVLYNELTLKHKIDTQTYPSQLKQYPPTKAYLNYESVNNNKATFGNHKAKYDYTIKSVVDVSKLFLQTHMAHYIYFDDTCDSSALLGLIINIDKFPPVVKSDAENVRRNIRNPWAHCDFTEWDAVKYSDSFQLMEKLVKNLSLISTEEHQIIGELKKWEINGQHFLSGTTLGLELVNDIRKQTQVLAEYTNQVAGKTDYNSIRIMNVLENFDTLFNAVTQLKKDMEEIDKRLLVKEEKYDSLNDSQKGEIEFWKEQEVTFVDTPVVHRISKIIESEHSVLIIGEPGIGKSMLLHYVALKLQKENDYNIIPCSGMQDILHLYKEDRKQMFVLDDICGRFTVSRSGIEYWMNNEEKMKRILKKGKTKIAATCRLDIFNDEKFKESCTVFKCNICNLSVDYSREDRLTICKQYLSETNIKLLKDTNVYFTPLMCYLYSKSKTFKLTDFLECPFETYQKEWDTLRVFDPYKYCSLFLCVIYNGIMKESLFDIYNENSAKNKLVWENIFEICLINRGTSKIKIKTILDSMIGTYVMKIGHKYKVIHDQMFDFMCCYFGNEDAMVRCILRFSDIRVFNQRTQLESINKQHGKFTIMISKKHEKEYFERIKCDFLLGKMNQCFCNTQMKYEVYRTSFLKTLKSIDDTFLNRINVTNADSIETMEFEDCSDDDHQHDCFDSDYEDDYADDVNPFIQSCLRGYYDIVQYFISKSVDRKSCDSFHSPLTAACKGGNEKIVQLLIDKGSDVNQVDSRGCSPLNAACHSGHEKIIQLLIDKGSDVNQVGTYGYTPLTAACSGSNEKIIQLLIDKGSDVNQVDRRGCSPLTAACSGSNEKIIQLLIDKGSDVNQVDRRGCTPLTAALEVMRR